MDLVVYVLSILMWILCPVLIGLILLQGAAGDISSAFGGGGQLDASLGVGAHRKMAQVTGVLAIVFFIAVLVLAYPHRGSFRGVDPDSLPTPALPTDADPVGLPPFVTEPAMPPAQPTPEAPAQPEAAPAAPAQPEAQPQPEAAPQAPAQPEAAAPAPAQPDQAAVEVPAQPAPPAEPLPATQPALVPTTQPTLGPIDETPAKQP